MVLLEGSDVTFDLIRGLYKLFEAGVLSVHQQITPPTPRQVRGREGREERERDADSYS